MRAMAMPIVSCLHFNSPEMNPGNRIMTPRHVCAKCR
jgi:hypothetical protein